MYVNAPRYLLRKQCVLKLIKDLSPNNALDIGCGAGDMVNTLAQRHINTLGIDFSDEAVAFAKRNFTSTHANFQKMNLNEIGQSFDLIIFMEVLEHIQDDVQTLKDVYNLINPQGHLIISVPAHSHKFGPSDVYVGHYRRYDKKNLIQLLESAGFTIETCWSYGVPLANLTEWIRNILYKNKKPESMESGTKKSGIDRKAEHRLRFFLNDFFMFPFYILQNMFRNTELGTGFIVKAKKK